MTLQMDVRNKIGVVCKTIFIFIIVISALLKLESCKNKNDISEISEKLSRVEAKLSDKEMDDALVMLLKLENNLDGTTPDTLRYKILSRIGSVYYAEFKKDKADEYFTRALNVARKCDSEYLSCALWNKCLTISNNDSIFSYLKECIDVSRENGMQYAEGMARINLANAYTQSGNMDKALELLDNMGDVIGDNKVLKEELSTAIQNYLIMDKQFDKAIEMLDKQNADELNLYGKLLRYQNYYTIELEREHYFEAIEYRDSLDRIQEKIDSIGYDEKLSKIESEFSSKLNKEKEYRIIASIIGLSIIILLMIYLWGRIKSGRMMKKQLELNEQISKLNLAIARLTETHDDVNTVSVKDVPDVEAEMIEKLKLNRELFMCIPVYGRLKELNLKRDTDSIDKAVAKEILDVVIGQFADICSNLRQLYSGMTYDDALYCSAIYVGFTKEVASVAFGSSEDALRRRKSRIKQKLPNAVFEAIFGTKV
ncbi:MAG: hypothetical protein K2J65_06320 [Duncaniella sp.]|nr:hypothetical protein [Duncaniella sp.]